MYILVFLISAMITWGITPFVRRFALRAGVLERVDERRVQHRERRPLLGGIGLFFVFWGVVFLSFFLGFEELFKESGGKILGLFAGSLVIFLLGIYDDVKGAKASTKLIFQILAALILVLCGFSISRISNPFGGGAVELGIFAPILTFLWIVGITNAVNLLDGLDGLADGIVAIVAITLLICGFYSSSTELILFSSVLAGVCLGFLPHNFYPARIFLGDTGSMFLGFLLGGFSLWSWQKATTAIGLLVPVIAMALPILDTSLAIFRRIGQRRHPFQADKHHIHHRLMAAQPCENQRNTVLKLYFISGCYSLIALSFLDSDMHKGYLPLTVLLLVVLLTVRWIKGMERGM